MYQSPLDPHGKLAFPFDPLRALHAHEDSALQWPEFPYKQVLIDRVRSKSASGDNKLPRVSVEGAAGALLMALGQETGALFEIEQHRSREGDEDAVHDAQDGSTPSMWRVLECRFRDERAAFQAAKRAYLLDQKRKVQSKLDAIETRKREEEAQEAHEAWRCRQIIKRFDDGSKYDGDGVRTDNVLVPHGHGTLYVPQKQQLMTESLGEIKRVPRYTGEWMNGFMHGPGTYFWDNGDSWTGHFLRDELEGKGVYTFGSERAHHSDEDDSDDDRGASREPLSQRVRYYCASEHVCWGDELVRGCRLLLFTTRQFGQALATVIPRRDVALEHETEVVLVSHNAANDTHLVRVCGTEDTKWLSLHNVRFRVVPSKPVARLEGDELTS